VLADKNENAIYSDLTGQFLVQSYAQARTTFLSPISTK